MTARPRIMWRGVVRLVMTEGFAHASEFYGTEATTQGFARITGMMLDNRDMNARVVEAGLATWDQLTDLREAFRAWGEDPGAFLAWMYCGAFGWVDPHQR